ncbi:MAG TPA: hypothetical protein VKC59_02305 [Candidatus Limnocylindrales bacterium]|nr:hypothetical protein [Candidatus Limnocylindrales bacterium]
MSDYNLSLDHHLSEIQQVAADLRAERLMASQPVRRGPNRVRIAIGEALLQVGSALVASQARQRVQAR